jgi:hypothetical protein
MLMYHHYRITKTLSEFLPNFTDPQLSPARHTTDVDPILGFALRILPACLWLLLLLLNTRHICWQWWCRHNILHLTSLTHVVSGPVTWGAGSSTFNLLFHFPFIGAISLTDVSFAFTLFTSRVNRLLLVLNPSDNVYKIHVIHLQHNSSSLNDRILYFSDAIFTTPAPLASSSIRKMLTLT